MLVKEVTDTFFFFITRLGDDQTCVIVTSVPMSPVSGRTFSSLANYFRQSKKGRKKMKKRLWKMKKVSASAPVIASPYAPNSARLKCAPSSVFLTSCNLIQHYVRYALRRLISWSFHCTLGPSVTRYRHVLGRDLSILLRDTCTADRRVSVK